MGKTWRTKNPCQKIRRITNGYWLCKDVNGADSLYRNGHPERIHARHGRESFIFATTLLSESLIFWKIAEGFDHILDDQPILPGWMMQVTDRSLDSRRSLTRINAPASSEDMWKVVKQAKNRFSRQPCLPSIQKSSRRTARGKRRAEKSLTIICWSVWCLWPWIFQ